jgi:hypothetical protein
MLLLLAARADNEEGACRTWRVELDGQCRESIPTVRLL